MPVDLLWRLIVLSCDKYETFCRRLFKKSFLHRSTRENWRAVEYGQTRKLYIKFFNYPDTAYWPLYANKDHLSAAWNSLMWIQLSDLFDL